jgi:anti-anti-sigma factor
MMLSGETDLAGNAKLSVLITAELAAGVRHLTIDVSGLRFAGPTAIRTLILAALILKDRGGSLVLLRPQQPVARALANMGAEHMLTIRGAIQEEPDARG